MKLFIYGTLMEGFENYNQYLKGKISSLQPGKTKGKLYHLPENYPALLEGEQMVKGEIAELIDEKDLDLIDGLEEYKGPGKDNLYERIKKEIITERGKKLLCWTYLYNDGKYAEKEGFFISSGDWKKWMEQNKGTKMKKYFAYGKDTSLPCFKKTLNRVLCDKNFNIIGPALLKKYKAYFTGKEDLNIKPSYKDSVSGILYELPEKAFSVLYNKERYEEKEVTVYINEEKHYAITFEAINKELPEREPSEKYLEKLIKYFKKAGFSETYINSLKRR